jgi:hypothetical protein
MAGPMPTLKFLKGQSKNPIVPGICLIDNKFKFFYNKTISDGQTQPIALFYQCGLKKSTKCPASVVLTKVDDKWWPQNLSPDEMHNHASDRGAVLAHIMKKEMIAKVTSKPETKAEEAYREVITEFEDRFGDEEQVWDDAIANLPDKENLARNMRHIRSKEHGPLPKNRDDFDPEAIVRSTVGGKKIIIMDSNKHLDREYYSKLNAFENNHSHFNEDLEQFILDANDADIDEEESFDGEREQDEQDAVAENSEERPINPFYAGESSSDTSNASETVEKRKVNPFYAYVGDSSSNASNESTSSENVMEDSIHKKKPKRIIAYSTKFLLTIFNQRKSSGDGTFKICPSLWKQLYIVMVKFGNSWIPVCYALLPDKCKETYFTFFYMVGKQIKDMNLKFNIKSMRMDFEVGAMKAAAAAWMIVVKGCYYHFTQSGWRFVQTNNMASAYLADNDQEFKLLVKCVLSLPHVPVEDLENTIEILSDKEWDFGESLEKHEFKEKILKYVRDYWVDGQIPPQVWNCFHRKVDLTNNNNESHNNYLNNALKEAHPTPAKLTVALVKELTLAETKLRKVKSGANRVLKKTYEKLNKRRDNLKKMYHKMDRIEYLSQIGNIVMKIQLNKGQMAELQTARDKANDIPTDVVEDDNAANLLESDDDDESTNRENSSNLFVSTGNETLSSAEGSHPYEERLIGQVATANGKKTKEYEVPEYKNKKCLSCRGKFNIKSKYQVCKLCDQLIHVNNNKKCHKMKQYAKDKNFVCYKCANESEEPAEVSHEASLDNDQTDVDIVNTDEGTVISDSSHEASKEYDTTDDDLDVVDTADGTNTINKSIDFANLTIDGVPCAGLIFEAIGNPQEVSNDAFTSVDTVVDSEQVCTRELRKCSNCSFRTRDKSQMKLHKEIEQVPCHVCFQTFKTKQEMLKHIDVMHFHPCPICETVFLRSFEKTNHITQNHKAIPNEVESSSNFGDEQEFQRSIVRTSTLRSEDQSKRLVIEFVGNVSNEMKDMKKKRRKGLN